MSFELMVIFRELSEDTDEEYNEETNLITEDVRLV